MRFWESELLVRSYDDVARTSDWGETLIAAINNLGLGRHARILDIGAGTGTHVIPLADTASLVTAVEPSGAMLSRLKQNLASSGIANVTCLNKRWEDVDPARDLKAPYDVVIASFSLGMLDLRDAIARMTDVCRGYVFLIWNHGIQGWERMYMDLWPSIHGRDYVTMPGDDILLGVLRQMGIAPDVSIHGSNTMYRFSSIEEAAAHFAAEICIPDAVERNTLAKYLMEVLVEEGGSLAYYDHGDYVIISWRDEGDAVIG
ncbi:MAG: class I SAM-dependent methyltransferase [Actinomycetota bacterium]